MFNNKGKNPPPNSPIGLLVLIIGLLFLAYVILLPECDKCSLLDEDCPSYCEDKDRDNKTDDEIFLLESPGDVDNNPDRNIIHDLGNINLFIRDEPEINNLASRLEVYNGLFGDLDHDLSFRNKDLDNVERATLSFNVLSARGKLIVDVNGNQVLSRSLSKGGQVIDVPVAYLSENNKIRVGANSPGILFWLKNRYDLSDVKFKTVFEVVQSKQSETFRISQQEKDSLDDVTLTYTAFCRNDESKVLSIHLNGKPITSRLVDCFSSEEEVDIPNEEIDAGLNEIIFSINEGDFTLDNVEIETRLTRDVFIEYEFEIEDKDDFDDYFLRVEMEEIDDDFFEAEFIINGRSVFMNTKDRVFERDITDLIKEGENKIKIKPSNEFTIEEIRIWGE